MNSYLRPLVKELNALWTDGVQVSHKEIESCNVFAALIATMCDIPPMKKLMEFTGHNSSHCCWKCKKVFRHSALITHTAKTPTERSTRELNSGSCFTELMHFQYFYCVQYTIIDPMHNLLLGTARLENGLIRKKELEIVEERISNCISPIIIRKYHPILLVSLQMNGKLDTNVFSNYTG